MTLAEFRQLIEGKIFIELTTTDAVSSFTAIDPSGEGTGEAIRNEATTAGVLVFLKTINKIFARGTYYGISAEDWSTLSGRITELETTINSMGSPLANLVSLVATNTESIAAHTKIFNGDHSVIVPEDTSDPNYEAAKTQYDGLISRINTAWAAIRVIDPSGGDITGSIETIVDNRLDSVLDGRIADYLDDNNYLQESDITTIRDGLTALQTAITQKAAQTDLTALIDLIGAGTIDDQAWGQTSTVITVVNDLKNTTQTLQTTVSGIESAITGIPKFAIKVVDTLPIENISTTTIYLVKSPDTEQEAGKDMYTEYIYINKNAGHEEDIDPTTQEPIGEQWVWEKLGRQVFQIDKYLNEDDIKAITDPLVSYIDSISGSISAETATQVQQNTTNISTLTTTVNGLQTAISTIQTSLGHLIDANGNLQFTGEDINTTSAQDSLTIAQDIEGLKTNKLDVDSIQWAVY